MTDIERMEQKDDNVGLRILVEQQKRSVKQLTVQLSDTKDLLEQMKDHVQELTDQLRNRKSRVILLEADKYILTGDINEKSIVVKELRDALGQLSERLKNENVNGRKEKYEVRHKEAGADSISMGQELCKTRDATRGLRFLGDIIWSYVGG
jgi:hypothetical protein